MFGSTQGVIALVVYNNVGSDRYMGHARVIDIRETYFGTGSADSNGVLTAYFGTPVRHVRRLHSLGGLSFLLLTMLLSRLAELTSISLCPINVKRSDVSVAVAYPAVWAKGEVVNHLLCLYLNACFCHLPRRSAGSLATIGLR